MAFAVASRFRHLVLAWNRLCGPASLRSMDADCRRPHNARRICAVYSRSRWHLSSDRRAGVSNSYVGSRRLVHRLATLWKKANFRRRAKESIILEMNDSTTDRNCERLGAVLGTQLVEYVAQMALHCIL